METVDYSAVNTHIVEHTNTSHHITSHHRCCGVLAVSAHPSVLLPPPPPHTHTCTHTVFFAELVSLRSRALTLGVLSSQSHLRGRGRGRRREEKTDNCMCRVH